MAGLNELSATVRTRRTDMGLTQMALATLSGLSRATVVELEKGTIKDLSMTRVAGLLEALGLSIIVSAPRAQRHMGTPRKSKALDLAARTASVSYKIPIRASQLRRALTTGMLAPEFLPHVHTLLDEAPVSLLASVVEQLHHETGLTHKAVWRTMRELAHRLKSNREIWQ